MDIKNSFTLRLFLAYDLIRKTQSSLSVTRILMLKESKDSGR